MGERSSSPAGPAGGPRPAIFLDRDGVLNIDRGYVHRIEDFEWLPGAIEAIRLANERGFLVFVVTNQSGVARGLYGEEDVQRLHDHMRRELARHGAHIDDIRYCPYHPDGTVPRYARASSWRKPQPGMILDLLAHWPVDTARSVVIGDRQLDLDTARAAGLEGLLVESGRLFDAVQRVVDKP
jgi:D-glycero-D-manno-heptose 1,7-bisphosphate phosphatase